MDPKQDCAVPKPSAYAECWVWAVRAEVAGRLLITGPRHLRAVLDERAAHHNGHRPHRARDLRPPDHDGNGRAAQVTSLTTTWIRRHEVPGG